MPIGWSISYQQKAALIQGPSLSMNLLGSPMPSARELAINLDASWTLQQICLK